jgi:anti-anti-sigma regulatory factor
MLRIRRYVEGGTATFALSGRIEEANVSELKTLLEGERQLPGTTLDLEEVRLVDRAAVGFLVTCEARGVKLLNCPSYVREWISNREDASHE